MEQRKADYNISRALRERQIIKRDAGIIDRYCEGYTVPEIAKRVKMTRTSVYRILRQVKNFEGKDKKQWLLD